MCVATVGNVLEGRVLLHFDGWEIDYDYWSKPSRKLRKYYILAYIIKKTIGIIIFIYIYIYYIPFLGNVPL